MKFLEEFKLIMSESSGKKLAAFSIAVFLIITAIISFAGFNLCRDANLKLMDEYLSEMPKIIDSRNDELEMRGQIYQDDITVRSELGLKIYQKESGLTDKARLDKVRSAVSAASISLLDDQGQLLLTTGYVSPQEDFNDCIKSLKPRTPHLELYPVHDKAGDVTRYDGKGFVMLPVPGNETRSMVFEFSCDTLLELYNALGDASNLLERMLSGRRDAQAFARTNGRIVSYPSDSFTPGQIPQLNKELAQIFQNSGSFKISEKTGRPSKIIKLLDRHYLAALMKSPQEDTDILLTIPLIDVFGNFIYISVAFLILIGFEIVLLQAYISRCAARDKAVNFKQLCMSTWPGVLIVLAVTVVFYCMIVTLESRTSKALTAVTKRLNVQSEINFYQGQARTLRDTFTDFYRTRAQMFADFLTEYPDYQTREGLKELNAIAKTDYIMLFDSTGQELISSNSYTGFKVGKNLSEEYQAVIMGYPYAVVGPAADPYTKRMQFGAAIMITDRKGQPDGFLLAVYSAGGLNAEFNRMSYENIINNFAVQKGHIAAAINDATGRFIAHTDKKIIGLKAADFLDDDVKPGSIFEGFTDYNDESVYVSAGSSDGRTLLFIVPERGDIYLYANFILVCLVVLLILTLVYYPIACVLTVRAMSESNITHDGTGSPIKVFTDGYSIFMTLFTIIVLIASYNGWWTSFDYVIDGGWSNGVNLFSLWAALLIMSITLCCEALIRTVLNILESRLSLQGKTAARIINSLIVYAVNIFLLFYILSMFGLNTTALMASAGVISIAVGMGAQSMASDLLAGFFMMMEDSVHVGDYVSIAAAKGAGIKGHVTDMGIRTTEITDDEGNVIILNNSHVSPLCNMSRKHEQQPSDLPQT
ncbi:MAG: mechanosensitive ion channel [Synergistaceae bacterium]|nr:mechanosensitive ion channel [Synergistaceae bacterium]